MILPCGRLIAPGTWPLANRAGLRMSSRTKSAPLDRASCTSQQSVSKVSSAPKWASASDDEAAGMAVTALDIEGLRWKARYQCRLGKVSAIGVNAIYGQYHAKCQNHRPARR